ncbi:Fc.00g061640.m01.CDS01 [Cosmosporella sp. VM-42]
MDHQNGEGSSGTASTLNGPPTVIERTASASSASPDVVVLDSMYHQIMKSMEKPLSPSQDLWLTTVDGRYSSPMIPVRVGSVGNMHTFYVHKDILFKSKWFQIALCGGFKESEEQVVDLPEEDPAIFHFLVAFLYEGRFNPIRSASTVLEPKIGKGKGVRVDPDATTASDTTSSTPSAVFEDTPAVQVPPAPTVRGARARNNYHNAGHVGPPGFNDKRPGAHRPECRCPTCSNGPGATPCWQCGASRYPPTPVGVAYVPYAQHYRQPVNPPLAPLPGFRTGEYLPVPPPAATAEPKARIKGEDMQTWLMAYELTIDVYICANRYLMDDFRNAVARATIDMLETAGNDAAHPTVLRLCQKLLDGVPESDPLLKMVLARVGFLQPLLWKRAPEETSEVLMANPEMVTLMLKETVLRQQATRGRTDLPSMERDSLYE